MAQEGAKVLIGGGDTNEINSFVNKMKLNNDQTIVGIECDIVRGDHRRRLIDSV
jgi:hypothetical protein